MANPSLGAHRREASPESTKSENFDDLFENSSIPTNAYEIFDQESSEDEARKTQRVVFSSKGSNGETLPMASVGTTGREDPGDENAAPGRHRLQIFSKLYRNPRRPLLADVELGLATSKPNPLKKDLPPNLQRYEIMHNWTLRENGNEIIAEINVVDRPQRSQSPGSPSANGQMEDDMDGHVIWLHAEDSMPSLKQLETWFQEYLAPGLPYYLKDTASSTLARVRASSERKTIGGKYLLPGVMRYDVGKHVPNSNLQPGATLHANNRIPNSKSAHLKENLDDSEKNPCHPQRTLLQSRYHLESTKYRDKTQSITKLSPQEVQDSFRSNPKSTPHVKRKKWAELIYVSQFWALSVSGDKMITSAPLSDAHLRGSWLPTKSFQMRRSGEHRNPFVIKINLEYEGKTEAFLYPTEQCDWYFGLMNKERRIVETLGHRKGQVDVPTYKLYAANQAKSSDYNPPRIVTEDNWLELLASHRGGTKFELDMARDVPEITVNAPVSDDNSNSAKPRENGNIKSDNESSKSQDPEKSEPSSTTQTRRGFDRHLSPPTHRRKASQSSARSSFISERQPRTPIEGMVPFFQWPFDDDKHHGLYNKVVKRVRTWLDHISKQLPSDVKSVSIRPKSIAAEHQAKYPVLPNGQMVILSQLVRLQCEVAQILSALDNNFIDHSCALSETLCILEIYYDNLDLKTPDDSLVVREAKGIIQPLLERTRVQDLDLEFDSRDIAITRIQDEINSLPAGSQPDSTVRGDMEQNKWIKPIRPSSNALRQHIETLIDDSRHVLKLFIPEKSNYDAKGKLWWNADTHELMGIYRNLLGSIICRAYEGRLHIEELAALLMALDKIILLAEAVHKGVLRVKRENIPESLTKSYEPFEGIVILTPLPEALKNLLLTFHAVNEHALPRQRGGPADVARFRHRVGRHLRNVENNIKTARDYLIAGAEHGALKASLGPVVTPETILLQLLERLGRGVYLNGTVNILEIYEKTVEKTASTLDFEASRDLQIEIKRIAEELDIIYEVLKQQRDFFVDYRSLLDPAKFIRPAVRRSTRFEYEKVLIQRNLELMDERLRDCKDLIARTKTLAEQNIQLIETYQDDRENVLRIFTFVTVLFLPLSFVTGFFGMNVVGITGTTSTVRHFWVIAIPVTVGVGVISLIVMFRKKLLAWLKKKHMQKSAQKERTGR